ncbi:MAG: folylpolyglutamate synthase/dihydrofolate synthase family protein [Chthoniobacteraceae bacterium]
MKYDESVAWLYSTQLHGIRPGLTVIRRLIDATGLRLEGPKFLHVAGTNGKGSVCAMLDAICRAGGKRTGLFTSPHLVTFRERIRVDGEMIGEAEVARRVSELRVLTESWDPAPTFFELVTALALGHFQRAGCEVVVFETGMGGRLDATNVITPAVSVITPVALDHQQWLGGTLAEIAAEKAGIFTSDVPVVSAPQAPEVEEVLRRHAREVGVLALEFVAKPWTETPVALAGSHQQWHAATAVHAVALAALGIHAEAIVRGLREVQWPGRFQQIGEKLVLDGAHNPAAAVRLVETWREVFGGEQATLILGVLADKDLRTICAALLPLAARVIAVPVPSPRTCAPEEVRALVEELSPETPCVTAPDLALALTLAASLPERTLLCGSLFLVGQALARDSAPERSAQ